MTPVEILLLVMAFTGGIVAGVFFFAGLGWTVQRLASTRNPALLLLGSFLIRTIGALFVFYIVANGSWVRLMVCLIGFVFARFFTVRRWEVKLSTSPEGMIDAA